MSWRRVVAALMAAQICMVSGAFAQLATDASEPAPVTPGIEPDIGTGVDLGGPSLDFQDEEEPVLVSPDAAAYQFYITDLESRMGPYAQGLSEQLLGLGMAYQNQGLHQQAANVFKRGVHIARINDGLYSPAQIPLLQRMIQSLVAVGDYETADERQYYLFRVQAEVYGRQSPQMSLAMLQRAEWERQAYNLSLGDTAFMRLLTMWELYSSALRNIARQEGNLSTGLLQPLEGLLQTQYLISTYSPEAQGGFQTGGASDGNFAEENRFSMIRVSNYKQGQSVLTAMREVYVYNEGESSPLPAETQVQLGDWHLWHQKREAAQQTYTEAWNELSTLEDGERLQQQYFGAPRLLPDLPGASSEPTPPDVVTGYVTVSFSVTHRGRVKNLELVSNEPVIEGAEVDDSKSIALLRDLKRLLYRPRLEAGDAVQTDNILKRYAY
ncbi:MAG: hypothetical protein QNI86_11645 [Halieaceae bacterium]|nr:hypothetical protein [Halieaceae bacterium]